MEKGISSEELEELLAENLDAEVPSAARTMNVEEDD